MNIRRKLAAFVSGLVLTLALAPSVGAVSYSNCVDVDANYAPTWLVIRNSSTYYAAQGEVVIRQLHGCTNASGSLQKFVTFAFPANLEGTTDFKQIGYGVVTDNGTAMNWFATCCSGWAEVVTGMSLTFFPVVGDTVRFSIYRYAPGGLVYWRLKVDDLSHPGWYGWRDLVQVGSSTNQAWYGIEVQNKKSQFGSNSSTNLVRLRGLSYRLSNGGAWNYLEGTGSTSWANTLTLGTPACWIESVSTYAGPISGIQTSLNGWTGNAC